MRVREVLLPANYHAAVESWRDMYLPDYQYLIDNWDKYFPKDPVFKLCAFRELGMCDEIECGDHQGKSKATKPSELPAETAHHLLAAIRAQASTEFGSIQQHRLTLARAQDAEEQMWVLRMMAEELRHGYQMLHLLAEGDWSIASEQKSSQMVEEILSMQTGSHVLGAFNIDFDSFVDNIVFCALIDRVGKYQLTFQKISAYKPMAESMPQMLREEAFHLATGVVPMRRFMVRAAEGEVYVTVEMLQKVLNKWLPRGLEMFGDERGGASNVKMGLKPLKNAEAQQQYYNEVAKVVEDLNLRYIRTKRPNYAIADANAALKKLEAERGTVDGLRWEELLHMPHMSFFRRRGVPAFHMVGVGGELFQDVHDYLRHLTRHLPESYLASKDFKDYVEILKKVASGEISAEQGGKYMPELRRVGGSCPCSKSVRWVREESLPEAGVLLNGG